MNYNRNHIERSPGFAFSGIDVNNELEAATRKSVVIFDLCEQRRGRFAAESEKARVYEFNSAFLQNLQSSIYKQLQVLEKELAEYKRNVHDLLASKYEKLIEIRKTEKEITKLKNAEFNLWLELSESILKMSYKVMKGSVVIFGSMAKDIITGKLPLSLSAITDRLTADISNLAGEVAAEGLNTLLTVAMETIGSEGGIIGEALVGLASAVNDIVSAACSGPVADIMNTAKTVANAALAQPGDALKQLAVDEGTRYANLASEQVKEYNDISEASGIRGHLRDGVDAVQKAQQIPDKLQNAVEDTAMNAATAVGKEALAVTAQAFPAIKAGAAVMVGVANIYSALCDTVGNMPILQQIGDSADAAQSNNKARNAKNQSKIDELQKKVDSDYAEYEQMNRDIIENINNHTATVMQYVQYSFSAAWLIQSCCQISSLAKTFPYLNRDELITMYWNSMGDQRFLEVKDLVNFNMFAMMMRGFIDYLDIEIQFTPLSCPLIDKDLENQLSRNFGLTKSNYCKYMSTSEVDGFISQYKKTKLEMSSIAKPIGMSLDEFIAQYRKLILEKTRKFNQRFFANENMFKSYTLRKKNPSQSALEPLKQGYFDVKLKDNTVSDSIQIIPAKAKQNILSDKEDSEEKNKSSNIIWITLGLVSLAGIAFMINKKQKHKFKRK